MASTWDSKYIIESISEDFEEHFKKESDNSLVTYYKVNLKTKMRKSKEIYTVLLQGLLNNCKKAVSYKDSLQITVSAWEYISQYEVVTNAEQV